MRNKIISLLLAVLFIAVSVTLYKTDKKYSALKDEIKKKNQIIENQTSFINKKNLSHEIGIKESMNDINFDIIRTTDQVKIKLFDQKTSINFFKNTNQLARGINNFFPGSAYVDIHKDKIFLVSATGILGYANKNFDEKIVFKQIKNNIEKFLTPKEIEKGNWFSVKDILVLNDKIFISFTNEQSENCWNTSIIYANLNLENLEFTNFFEPKVCVKVVGNEDNEFNAHQSGGKVFKFDDDNIIFSTGDFRLRSHAQSKETTLGKIIKININNGSYNIISIGHRNPQGLLYDKEQNLILSTEHGPHGGDEINLNSEPSSKIKNFGWAISSYGEHYGGKDSLKNKDKYLKYPLHKSHSDYGFIEPIKYFVPSIGISEIVQIDKDKFIVSSLKDSSIYPFRLENNKIKNMSRVVIGERIRDMIYDKETKKIWLFLEDSASLGIINFE